MSPLRRTCNRIVLTPQIGPPWPDGVVADLMVAFQEALKAADPQTILESEVALSGEEMRVRGHSFDLSRFDRVLVMGGGKASAGMAAGLERKLGKRITSGVVNTPEGSRPEPCPRRILLNEATHPIPSEKGIRGVEMMLRMVGRPTRRDMVVCLLSGGGSALIPLPLAGVGLREIQLTTDLLLKSGADIDEVNAVRKHLSAVKGGRLAEKLYPATVLSLVISDVVGDRLDSVASGPTAPDMTTYAQAEAILRSRGLWKKVPRRVRETLTSGVEGRIKETPKEGDKAFGLVSNVIIGGNRTSCTAAARSLRGRGYKTMVLSTRIQGEAREVGRVLSSIVTDINESKLPFPPPAAIVSGGETTVTVRGDGKGGRNQELVLSAAIGIAGQKNAYIASLGTDGIDGPTAAAGALAGPETVPQARRVGLNPCAFLENNDSNGFFGKVGGLIVTGPTGTNVNDIMIAIAPRP